MSNASQDGREAILATPLGKDVLLFSRMDCIEGMGELFEFRIEALSSKAEINFDQALGRNCSIHLETNDKAGRDFSGVLTEARWLGQRGDYHAYSLVLRPWLWLLSLTSDCRIYPNLNPKEIIKQVFKNRGFGDSLINDKTTQDYPTLEYTVQYRETDLNFVLRLMEEYGIYYYFQFEKGAGGSVSGHQLVLADSTTYTPLPGLSQVAFAPTSMRSRRDLQQFNTWTKNDAMVTGVFTLNDYNYESPGANLLATSQHSYKFEHGSMEIYRYIGDYDKQNEGQKLADVARDVERTRNQRYTAAGYAPTLTPGYATKRASLGASQGADSDDGDYLLLRCSHAYGYQTYESATGGGAGAVYVGTYELAKSDLPYRMPQHTPKPSIYGTQSALVVGKEGEEIDVDDQGRICVQFYWDRKKTASRRIRVAQQWAGGHRRGFLFIPRIGDEVLVQYDEGDPDRPIAVGSVYNGAEQTPWKLPSLKNFSGIRSDSTKGHNGHHVIGFDDSAGAELMYLRAQKDLQFYVLNNELRNIVANQTENVGGNETITVGKPPPNSPPSAGGGNFQLNAVQTATINVGPVGMPATQIVMDTSSITLNVGPSGLATQIVMNTEGITLSVGPGGTLAQIQMGPMGVTISGTPASQLMVQPMGISTMTPMMNLMAEGPISFVSPMVNIPLVTIGAGTSSGLPII